MFLKFFDFLKLRHYKRVKSLKAIGALQLYITIILIFLPLYFRPLIGIIYKFAGIDISKLDPIALNVNETIGLLFSWLITILALINLGKEYLLSKSFIVGHDHKKELIRQLISYLMDRYQWRGTCRASLFLPDFKSHKLKVFERLSAGIGAGESDKCFFTMGQGIPGKAWESAWAGEGYQELVDAIQIGNIPGSVLRDKQQHRNFFKDVFGITDDSIYYSLSEKKYDIRSYMAVGILGRFQQLVCVLVIDSEQEEKFVDFETLQGLHSGTLRKEVTIVGDGDDIDDLPMPQEMKSLIESFRSDLTNQPYDEAVERTRKYGFMAHASRSTQLELHVPRYLHPLSWVLKQIRDIFLADE